MISDGDELARADQPRNRMNEHPTPEPLPIFVHPPGPTATCRTCKQRVKVMEFGGLAFWHHAPGSATAGCEDLHEYRGEVRAWQTERARLAAV